MNTQFKTLVALALTLSVVPACIDDGSDLEFAGAVDGDEGHGGGDVDDGEDGSADRDDTGGPDDSGDGNDGGSGHDGAGGGGSSNEPTQGFVKLETACVLPNDVHFCGDDPMEPICDLGFFDACTGAGGFITKTPKPQKTVIACNDWIETLAKCSDKFTNNCTAGGGEWECIDKDDDGYCLDGQCDYAPDGGSPP